MARARVAIGVCLVSLVTGCAGIPTSGEVVEGDSVPEQLPVSVGFAPNPPVPGASETGIVQGFVEAMASYEAGYPTAREFLTPEADAAWESSAAMTIYSANPTVSLIAAGEVRLTLTVEAVISPEAGFERRSPATTTKLELTLNQVEQEWRIANPPAGLLVSDQDFVSEFREYNTYYFDPDFEVLVPDPVYVPIQGSVPGLLVEALLRGPSRWLAPAVTTAFPEGTTRGLPVAVEAGRALVDLSAEAADGTPEDQRERMTAQLAWTLDQVDGVQQVVVRADGLPLTDPEPTSAPGESFAELDPGGLPRVRDLYAITQAGVVVGDRLTPVAGPLGDQPDVRGLAVDPRAGRAAVVDQSGTALLWAPFETESSVLRLATGSDLVSVSWDRTGLVWAVDHAPGGSRVIVCEPGGEAVAVPFSSGPAGRDIDDLAVSPDGSRVAVVSEGDVLVGIVLRGQDQAEVSIEGLRPVQIDGRAVTKAAWSSPTELAVLAREQGEAAEPFRVGLGGSDLSPAGPVPGAVDLAASPGQGLAVSTDEATLFRQTPTLRWDKVGEALAPTYPG